MGHYYIRTEAKSCNYTLRYTFNETRYVQTTRGPVYAGVVACDYHVHKLPKDRQEAISKALLIIGYGTTVDFDVTCLHSP